MAKFTPPTIASGYLSTEKINEAFADIAEAFENTLSRDGTTPNTMEADLDLNGHVLINTGDSSDDPERLVTYTEVLEVVEERSSGLIFVATERHTAIVSQTTFVLENIEFEVGTNNLAVYVDGLRQFLTHDYTETDSGTIEFLSGLSGGEAVDFVRSEYTATTAVDAHTHPWSQITAIPEFASRWPTWDEVTDKPTTFAPATHTHAASAITSGRLADARRGVHVQATEPTATTVGELWIW